MIRRAAIVANKGVAVTAIVGGSTSGAWASVVRQSNQSARQVDQVDIVDNMNCSMSMGFGSLKQLVTSLAPPAVD